MIILVIVIILETSFRAPETGEKREIRRDDPRFAAVDI